MRGMREMHVGFWSRVARVNPMTALKESLLGGWSEVEDRQLPRKREPETAAAVLIERAQALGEAARLGDFLRCVSIGAWGRVASRAS